MSSTETEKARLIVTAKHAYGIGALLVASVVIFALVGWGVLTFTVSGLREEIASLRKTDTRGIIQRGETEIDLRELIANIDKNTSDTAADLTEFNKLLDDEFQTVAANMGQLADQWQKTNEGVAQITMGLVRIEARINALPTQKDGNTPDLIPAPVPQ